MLICGCQFADRATTMTQLQKRRAQKMRLHTYPPRERMRAQGRSFLPIGLRKPWPCREKNICLFSRIILPAVQPCARRPVPWGIGRRASPGGARKPVPGPQITRNARTRRVSILPARLVISRRVSPGDTYLGDAASPRERRAFTKLVGAVVCAAQRSNHADSRGVHGRKDAPRHRS